MKFKVFLLAIIFSITMQAQNKYQLSLKQNSLYNYSVIAVPNFVSGANVPFLNDQQFVILLPDGSSVANAEGYSTALFTAIDDFYYGEDVVTFNMVKDIKLPIHKRETSITLATFDVIGEPTTGNITLLDNSSVLVEEVPNVFDTFLIGTLSGNLKDSAVNNYVGNTDEISYSFSKSSTVENTTAIEDVTISIYPNPTKDIIHVKDVERSVTLLEIYNTAGQKVMTRTSNMHTIDISTYNSGIYFVKLYCSKLKVDKTIKLIKD